jgi:hypothetical protein
MVYLDRSIRLEKFLAEEQNHEGIGAVFQWADPSSWENS